MLLIVPPLRFCPHQTHLAAHVAAHEHVARRQVTMQKAFVVDMRHAFGNVPRPQ